MNLTGKLDLDSVYNQQSRLSKLFAHLDHGLAKITKYLSGGAVLLQTRRTLE